MTKEFSSIVELKSIREQKSRLSERENELSSPHPNRLFTHSRAVFLVQGVIGRDGLPAQPGECHPTEEVPLHCPVPVRPQRAGRRTVTKWYPGGNFRRVPGCVPVRNFKQHR